MRLCWLILVLLFLFPRPAGAGEPPLLVVFALEDQRSGLGANHLAELSARLARELEECAHQIVAPAQVGNRLKPVTGRIPRKRLAQARLLKARRILVGGIRKQHSYCRIDAFLIDARTGEREKKFTGEADCRLDAQLAAVPVLAGSICRQLKTLPGAPLPEPKEPNASRKASAAIPQETAGPQPAVASRRKVLIRTRPPGARVTVNGHRRGPAPVQVTLRAGRRHEIRASFKDYEKTFLKFIATPAPAEAPPQEVTVELIPKPVYLRLDVFPPRARVSIGKERLVGSGTVGVLPGKRTIHATAEGYRPETVEVDIPAGKPGSLRLRLKPRPAWLAYREELGRKRVQAWISLSSSLLAFSASVPLIKWSLDSDRAAGEWDLTARLAEDPNSVLAARENSREARDRARWAGIAGYGSLALGVVALGFGLYSFLTCPDQPVDPRVGLGGNRIRWSWDF